MFLCLEDTKRAYFMSPRHTNRDYVFQKNIMSYLGKIQAPAGKLGGAPSMFLCLGDIESASFMSHLCPQGSNEAYFMSLRHKNQDSVFSKNIIAYFEKIYTYFEKIYKYTPYLKPSFF